MSKTGEIRSWNLSPQNCDGIQPEIYLQEHTLGVSILRVVFGFRGTEKASTAQELAANFLFTVPLSNRLSVSV